MGCALCIDLLKTCAIFSKVLQEDYIDILGTLTSLLKTVKEVNKLRDTPLDKWTMFSSTLKDEDGEMVYQCQTITSFQAVKEYYES